ncbi:MAG: hypothetical protein QF721_00890, partial [Verrucomicrobiota bacterium]|nr:hypothetical protein [Verrucomicrobiota bacterium]
TPNRTSPGDAPWASPSANHAVIAKKVFRKKTIQAEIELRKNCQRFPIKSSPAHGQSSWFFWPCCLFISACDEVTHFCDPSCTLLGLPGDSR